jgi:hypothetical protein
MRGVICRSTEGSGKPKVERRYNQADDHFNMSHTVSGYLYLTILDSSPETDKREVPHRGIDAAEKFLLTGKTSPTQYADSSFLANVKPLPVSGNSTCFYQSR